MGFYWRRSTKILPCVRINWSKSGPSVSVGPRGAKLNFSKRGTYASGSIPDTGMYYRQKIGGKKRNAQGNGSSYNIPNNQSSNISQQISSKGCLMIILSIIGLGLLLTGNFLTFIILVGFCLLLWLIFSVTKLSSNNNIPNTSATIQNQPIVNQYSNQGAISEDDSIKKKVAIAEIEHLIEEIDRTNDKIKLPSYYRKLMSIIGKIENEKDIEIHGLPIEEVKRRVIENYRLKMK